MVGELIPGTVHTRFELQRPDIQIRDFDTGKIVETIRSDVPDLLSLDGKFYGNADDERIYRLASLNIRNRSSHVRLYSKDRDSHLPVSSRPTVPRYSIAGLAY